MDLHNLLARQLSKHFGSVEAANHELQLFIKAVNEAYQQSDIDRGLLERSLELSSEELLRTNSELRESEEKYKALFSEGLDGIALADAETGILIDCNPALAALVGRERAELIGQHQKILHPPTEDQITFSPTFIQHLGEKAGQVLETQVITKTGEIREVEIKANLLQLRGRRMLQGLFRDITERKRMGEQLNEKLNELKIINDAAVGRELKMIELEKEVNELLAELGRKPKYK